MHLFYCSRAGPLSAVATMMTEIKDHIYGHAQWDRIYGTATCYSPMTLTQIKHHTYFILELPFSYNIKSELVILRDYHYCVKFK